MIRAPGPIARFLLGASLVACSGASWAIDEAIALSIGADRFVTATLTGRRFFCGGFTFSGGPSMSLATGAISVNSQLTPVLCPTPIGFPTPGPSPYTQAAVLGALADGNYVLTWDQWVSSPAAPLVRTQISFSIVAGTLIVGPPPIPTLSHGTLGALIALLLIVGIDGLKKPNARVHRRNIP